MNDSHSSQIESGERRTSLVCLTNSAHGEAVSTKLKSEGFQSAQLPNKNAEVVLSLLMNTFSPVNLLVIDMEIEDLDFVDLLEVVQVTDALRGTRVVIACKEARQKDAETMLLLGFHQLITYEQIEQHNFSALTKVKSVSGGAINVLVVEDDPTAARVVTYRLGKLGYNWKVAETGEEALRLLAQTKFDIGVFDYMLPDTNSIELLKTIRSQNGQNKNIPVLGISGVDEETLGKRCLASGMTYFLRKPLSTIRFKNTIEKLVSEYRRIKIDASLE